MEHEVLFNDTYGQQFGSGYFVPSFQQEVKKRHGNGSKQGLPPGSEIFNANNIFGEGNRRIHIKRGIGCSQWANCFTCPFSPNNCHYNHTGDIMEIDHSVLPHPYYSGGE